MLAALRSGKTSTLQRPATSEPSPTFFAATAASMAASSWNSPSAAMSGRRSWTSPMASFTRFTLSPAPEPLVEKERKPTRGSQPMMALTPSAAEMAMEASSEALGSGFRPQSVKQITPPSGPSKPGVSTSARMEGTSTPSARPMVIWAVMRTSPVVFTWPQKVQSTSPSSSMTMAHHIGFLSLRRMPLAESMRGLPASMKRVASASSASASEVSTISMPSRETPASSAVAAITSAGETSTGVPMPSSSTRRAAWRVFAASHSGRATRAFFSQALASSVSFSISVIAGPFYIKGARERTAPGPVRRTTWTGRRPRTWRRRRRSRTC